MMNSLNYSLLSNDLLYTMTKHVMTAFDGLNLDNSPLKPLVSKASAAFNQFGLAFERETTNGYTKVFEQLDEVRDEDYLGFRCYIEAWSHRSDVVKREAANKILDVIRRHGWSATILGYKAETTALSSMISELRNKLQAELTLLTADEWLGEVEKSEAAFEAKVQESASNAPTNVPTLGSTRPDLVKALRNLFAMIDLIAPSETSVEFATLISTLNSHISDAMTSAKAAATRTANQKAEEAKKSEGQ